jgi:protein-S-isoprenylcysteine O-methyltransferase Ste14
MSLFTVAFLIYFSAVVVVKVIVFRISGEEGGEVKDNWTFPAVFISYMIAVTGSLAEFFFRDPRVCLGISLLGYLLATMGVVITRHCVKTLGPWWSVRIEVKRGHQVVEKGPYRISRHPYYLATLLELGGLCLILNSFRTLTYVILVHTPIVIARIVSEERTLGASLGASYLDYRRRIRVLPFPSQ